MCSAVTVFGFAICPISPFAPNLEASLLYLDLKGPAMLLILIAVHLLSQDGIAAPLPHPPDARATTDSCNDINNCRTLFSVVWGCLATIFACTWVSVHPNVPPPGQSRLQLFWRRLKLLMLIATIAPEVIVAFAARQFFVSRWLQGWASN
ncbi:hypothetical protein MSAN_00621700 [Mycena sanguinolenta]|uniref:Uncharacterized protein n=1 Tax=Mycena sanguinolenta TaxID=230812 RepID=A0A8H6Z3C2_9AGAR|nr:hypothetical protein MSAN_00621700 [Mycena sanguinolenta]